MVTSAPKRRYIWRELQTDVTAADDDQMLRQKIHFHHARLVK